MRTEIPGGGGRGRLYLTLHCQYHHQNDSCIKLESEERRFNISSTVRGKVARQCPQLTIFFFKRKESLVESNPGPSAYQPSAFTAWSNRLTGGHW